MSVGSPRRLSGSSAYCGTATYRTSTARATKVVTCSPRSPGSHGCSRPSGRSRGRSEDGGRRGLQRNGPLPRGPGVVVTNVRPSRDAVARAQRLARTGQRIDFWTGADLTAAVGAGCGPAGAHPSAGLPERSRCLVDRGPRHRGPCAPGARYRLGEDGRWRRGDRSPSLIGPESRHSGGGSHQGPCRATGARPVEAPAEDRQDSGAYWRREAQGAATGVTFATVASALNVALAGYRPSLVMVDETHHVGEDGQYGQLLAELERLQPVRGHRDAVAWRQVRHREPFRVRLLQAGHRRGNAARLPRPGRLPAVP